MNGVEAFVRCISKGDSPKRRTHCYRTTLKISNLLLAKKGGVVTQRLNLIMRLLREAVTAQRKHVTVKVVLFIALSLSVTNSSNRLPLREVSIFWSKSC